jgi:hydrogenase maturation protease
MVAPVLIFAVGNESRGDDALGPLLLRDLGTWLLSNGLSHQFELLEDYQLQIEHAMDMKDRRLVLFVDAGMNTLAPFSFYRAQLNTEPVLYSHALVPETLLKVYEQFYKESPPDAFILCIQGEQFELGEDISKQAEDNLARAFKLGKMLVRAPRYEAWDELSIQKTLEHSICHEDNNPA